MPTTVSVLRIVQLLSRRLLLWRPTRTPLGCSLWNEMHTHNSAQVHNMIQFYPLTGIFRRQLKVCLRQCDDVLIVSIEYKCKNGTRPKCVIISLFSRHSFLEKCIYHISICDRVLCQAVMLANKCFLFDAFQSVF